MFVALAFLSHAAISLKYAIPTFAWKVLCILFISVIVAVHALYLSLKSTNSFFNGLLVFLARSIPMSAISEIASQSYLSLFPSASVYSTASNLCGHCICSTA